MFDVNGNILSSYAGKTLSILGDSISTFAGYIPEGNAVFYTGSNCGVTAVTDCWWMKLATALGMTICLNQSWSGSRVTTTSGVERAGVSRAGNLGTNPDVIIVYLGINDFNNEVSLGTYDGTGTFPTVTTTFREAYAIMMKTIMTTYPTAEVWCCTLCCDERNGDTGFPEINDDDIKLDAWNDVIREMAKLFGARVIENALCGITYFNLDTYMGDYSESDYTALHPNASGHSLIANNAIRQMDASVITRY